MCIWSEKKKNTQNQTKPPKLLLVQVILFFLGCGAWFVHALVMTRVLHCPTCLSLPNFLSSAFSSRWELTRPPAHPLLAPAAAIYKFSFLPRGWAPHCSFVARTQLGHGSVSGRVPASARRHSQGDAPHKSQSHQPGLGQSPWCTLCPSCRIWSQV